MQKNARFLHKRLFNFIFKVVVHGNKLCCGERSHRHFKNSHSFPSNFFAPHQNRGEFYWLLWQRLKRMINSIKMYTNTRVVRKNKNIFLTRSKEFFTAKLFNSSSKQRKKKEILLEGVLLTQQYWQRFKSSQIFFAIKTTEER